MELLSKPRAHRVGAPPGLTVHWLIFELAEDDNFTRKYKLSYNKKYHHYRFARYRKRTMIDEFVVIRTSKRCYRVSYFNEDYKHFQYFSAENYRDCAKQMVEIFHVFYRLEQVQIARERAQAHEGAEN
jgi:hypothetical protein